MPVLTIARAVCSTSVALTPQWKAYQSFQPIGGVAARPSGVTGPPAARAAGGRAAGVEPPAAGARPAAAAGGEYAPAMRPTSKDAVSGTRSNRSSRDSARGVMVTSLGVATAGFRPPETGRVLVDAVALL